jgi:hypothetical protein
MTPDEHQAAAEKLLDRVQREPDPRLATLLVARAHAHALLATRAPWTPPPAPRQGLADHLMRPRNPDR